MNPVKDKNQLKRNFAYTRIAEQLAEKIASGELAPGSFLLSERKLAETYDVNHATVRKATQLLADRGLVNKIQGKGIRVNGRQQKKRGTKFIGFILCKRQKSAPFYFELITFIEKELQKYGFHLIFSSYDDTANSEIPKMLQSSAVDAVIITGEVPRKLLKYLRQNQINHVLIAHASKFDRRSNIVSSDDSDIGYKAAKYLLQKHEKIALIRGSENFRPHDMIREQGFRQAFEECGRQFDERLLIECDSFESKEIQKKLLAIPREMFPDAIFTTTADFFNQAAMTFKGSKIKFISFAGPGDFRFIGSAKPVIIKTDCEEISRATVNRLIDILNGRAAGISVNMIPALISPGN
jgi:DNA-binding LacI/PurR family transcriptional regulator